MNFTCGCMAVVVVIFVLMALHGYLLQKHWFDLITAGMGG